MLGDWLSKRDPSREILAEIEKETVINKIRRGKQEPRF